MPIATFSDSFWYSLTRGVPPKAAATHCVIILFSVEMGRSLSIIVISLNMRRSYLQINGNNYLQVFQGDIGWVRYTLLCIVHEIFRASPRFPDVSTTHTLFCGPLPKDRQV